MIDIFWGPFALGVLVGMFGVITALLAYVVVDSGEFELYRGNGKEGPMFKNFFSKPIQVAIASEIRPGDFIHDISDLACALDIEKRKGHVISIASKIDSRQIVLKLTDRRTLLEVPENSQAVITREQESAKLISLNPRRAYV